MCNILKCVGNSQPSDYSIQRSSLIASHDSDLKFRRSVKQSVLLAAYEGISFQHSHSFTSIAVLAYIFYLFLCSLLAMKFTFWKPHIRIQK